MSRVKENKELMNELGKQAKMVKDLDIDATDSYNIGNILVILADISRSLAVIADKMCEEKQ